MSSIGARRREQTVFFAEALPTILIGIDAADVRDQQLQLPWKCRRSRLDAHELARLELVFERSMSSTSFAGIWPLASCSVKSRSSPLRIGRSSLYEHRKKPHPSVSPASVARRGSRFKMLRLQLFA